MDECHEINLIINTPSERLKNKFEGAHPTREKSNILPMRVVK